MPNDNKFIPVELSRRIDTDALMKIMSESNHVQQAQQEHLERLINNNAVKFDNFKNPMNDIVEQLKVANEINTELKNENLKLRDEVIKLQDKPKKWYQKLGVKISILIWFLISTLFTIVISQIIITNWDIIVELFK